MVVLLSTALLVAGLSLPVIGAAATTLRAADNYWDSLPATLPTQPVPTRSKILDADGTVIASFYSENRVPVTYGQISTPMRRAIVDIEDERFYEDNGVDYKGILRAFVHNATSNTTEGGSTIAQQYVKNLLAADATDKEAREEATSRTSYARKLREAKLAIELERTTSKNQILTDYLNIAYFGDGAYGIGTAARHYFGVSAKQLTTTQAALLAGLVQNPTGFNPVNHPKAAAKRRNIVLAKMHTLGDLSTVAYNRDRKSPLRLHATGTPNGCLYSTYPFYCQWVNQTLETDPAFGATQAERDQRLYTGGMTIKTNLVSADQKIAQRAVDQALGRNNRVAAEAVVVQPGTGKVLAMATNRTFGVPKPGSFDKTEILLPTQAAYQPGSNFKVFTIAAALEQGFNPKTVMYAPPVYQPTDMNSPPGGFHNQGSADVGNFTIYQATARSSNTWFVKLEDQVGVLNVAAMAQRLGITSLPMTGPNAITSRDGSLTLGAYEVSPVEMAGAYATVAAHGIHCTPEPIDSVTGPDGKPVTVPSADCHQAISPAIADEETEILRGVIDGPDPARTGKMVSLGRPAAGKTGTTQNEATVWFSGFVPQFETSVEISDPRGEFAHPLRGFEAYDSYVPVATGGSVAGPIWKQIMSGILKGIPVKQFTKPTQTVFTGTKVPDVRGLTLAAAYRALNQAGFKVSLSDQTAKKNSALDSNTVANTSPASGSMLGLDSTVSITMSDGSDVSIQLPTD